MEDSLGSLHSGEKGKAWALGLTIFKIASGLVLGLTLALVGQQILEYGNLSFLFVIVVALTAFYRLAKPWKYVGVLVFDLVAILVATLLKMYILVAPNL